MAGELHNPELSLSRRDFLSATAAAAAVLALAGCQTGPTEPSSSPRNSGGRSIGISPQAFERARARAEALVAQMTLAEKISQTGMAAPAIQRIGLPAYNYYSGEARHGLVRNGPVTSFPLPLALAATWNPDLIHRIYTAVSDEARAYNKKYAIGLSYYSPCVLNMDSDPRSGRCEEGLGEDPYLVSTIAAAMVRGMQGENPNYLKTTACAKYFICNNTGDDRTPVSTAVDPRSFWEYYTRPFRACVIHGDVFTVMSASSALNGAPCCADRFLLTDLLRRRWGFRGYVTSGCDAIAQMVVERHAVPTLHQAAALAMQAGCDLNCGDTYPQHLAKAVDLELVSQADISRAVTRLLTVRFLLGEFEPPEQVPYNSISIDVVDSPAHRALAVEAARQSLVLLKNENNFLPLNKSALKKVAVIGPLADQCRLGVYSGAPFVHISPLAGIAAALGVQIDHSEISAGDFVCTGGAGRPLHTEPSGEGNVDIGSIVNGDWLEFKPMDFTGKNEIVIRVASNTQGGVIEVHLDSLNGPLAATLQVPSTGGWQNWTNLAAPLYSLTGRHKVFFKFSGSNHLFNIEQFRLNPPSPQPPPRPGRPELVFEPGCGIREPKREEMFRKALDAARGADAVIMVCGIDQLTGGEGLDRKSLGLGGAQPELIRAVYQVNPKVVLVLSTNNSLAVNWEQEHLPAILAAVFAGQAQGTAIAAALFGDCNPGGKLPCTWYKSADQLGPFHNYNIFQDRTYMYLKEKPLYPFGYGLSYTTFQFGNLKISSPTLGPGETLSVSATITNTGRRAGAEVLQLYITPPPSGIQRPSRQLVGFRRVELQPAQSKTITFRLPYHEQAFWYWHEEQRRFVLEPGTAKLLIGNSSADIHLVGEVELCQAGWAGKRNPVAVESGMAG